MSRVSVFAPATVANVVVGVDVLGFALEGVGDTVHAEPTAAPGLVLETAPGVPADPARNTAGVAAQALLEKHPLPGGVRLVLEKGIPVSAGMGGSAASAVGAVVALNALLEEPLTPEELLPFALAGEAAASGAPHADNVVPCLYGGLTASLEGSPPRVVQIPPPPGVTAVVVHPHLEVQTEAARRALKIALSLTLHVRQTQRLAGFLAGCFRNDPDLVRASLKDDLITPQRAHLIPGFNAATRAAMAAGAWCCSISGSGPSLFAWCDAPRANDVATALTAAFTAEHFASDAYLSPVGARGARVIRA